MKSYPVYRLVKSADLNHHGTLFAGRTAEWFVESAFVAASCEIGNPEYIVCVNIHGMQFKSSVGKGDVICFTSRIAHLGTTSITVFTEIHSETRDIYPVKGFLTFVSVDLDGKKRPHNLVLDETDDEEELNIREEAKKLLGK
ncbi:MAG: acyl-CoA thioesterase [Ignavibacteria bacterium]|nr:acyl-CoA thioesterase [Ignavibacteria bacterium]